ncbi:bifunctional diaminohydroxyphosphoribosylaminopyrimidine deaminase/5-amino-6-(5-phosphoribosylamino)uracil reductase RibD [bacterium]|nr:bifunctional diaminohydroxyphosphoribosylaminopyrimidine deaminase/5-amino-6-(5-phosphoribosylamino)uracil reductase RibD [bacterium]
MELAWDTLDQQAMELCLRLAALGRLSAPPNPMVGAVVVQDEEIVGQAFHRAAGESHAEILALQQAGERARGATLYINLEPCCHQGRTPPCAPRLVEAGLARVVVGTRDPDPRVRGGGIQLLRAAGVQVQGCPDPWTERCLELNRHFIHAALKQRPFVTLKYAMTLDGRVATGTGDSRWISGPASRQQVHGERSQHQAIVVGSGTALADDPHLNVRGVVNAPQPVRIVLDRRGRLSPLARLFNAPGGAIWVGYGELAEETWKEQIRQAGGELFAAPDLATTLTYLKTQGVQSLLLEGGPQLAGAFLDQGLVQRLLVYVAPVLVGAHNAPGPLAGQGVAWMREAHRLKHTHWAQIDEDWVLDGELDNDWRAFQARCSDTP